jgi:cell division control protein 45
MYISDLRKDFFDVIKSHERVLVVANFDVDSVCAVKILQWLLKCDHVTYTLVPVRGKTDLIQAFKDNVGNENDTDMGSTVKFVVMINCGGTFDIVDFFEPPEDVTIFVADSHRPTDVCNIYSDGQVRLLMKQEDDEGE